MALFRKKQSDIAKRRQYVSSPVRTPSRSDDTQLFRRNRTLSGSTSLHVASVQLQGDQPASPRAHAHALSMQRRRVTGILLTVIIVAGALSWLLYQFTGSPSIVVSDTHMTTALNTVRYVKAIQTYLDANPLSRLRFALDQTGLNRYIVDTLPEVSSVEQQGFSGFGKSNFLVSLRTPVAGWKIGARQYYVDANGVPFTVNYFGTPPVQIDDQSGVGVLQGTAIVSNSFLGFVGKAVAASSQYGYSVMQAIIPAGTTRQLEIQLKGYSFLVKLSIDRGAVEQIEDMSRAVKYLVSKGITPQYIDVRVSGKAFYL